MTHEEALNALTAGKRVQYHYGKRTVEVTLNTSMDDLRWALIANMQLTVSDVLQGEYSIIE